MSPAVLFGLMVLLTFAILMLVLQPSKSQKLVQRRLETIERHSIGMIEDEASILRRESLSDIAWLNDIMQRVRIFVRLRHLLEQAESSWTVGRLFSLSLLLAATFGWLATYWVPTKVLVGIVGLAAGAAPYVYLFLRRAHRFRRFEEMLPDCIDLMARALRAGHTITSSIEMVSEEGPEPVASEFRRVFEEQNFGLPLREAMLNLAHRVPLPDVSFLVTAILVQKETGGNLAEILDKAAVVIRERFRLRGQLRVYTAQGRLTGWILAAMPFVMFTVLYMVNPQYERILLEDPAGQKLIYIGIGLMVAGGLFIRRIIDIKV